jgi:hypothetical protein
MAAPGRVEDDQHVFLLLEQRLERLLREVNHSRLRGVNGSFISTERIHVSFFKGSIPYELFFPFAVLCCIGDPDPDVLEPPGSGSISQRYRSGSLPLIIKVLIGQK